MDDPLDFIRQSLAVEPKPEPDPLVSIRQAVDQGPDWNSDPKAQAAQQWAMKKLSDSPVNVMGVPGWNVNLGKEVGSETLGGVGISVKDVLRKAVPFTELQGRVDTKRYGEALEAYKRGEATDTQYGQIAEYQLDQQREQARSQRSKIAAGALGVPKIVGEMAAAAPIAAGAGAALGGSTLASAAGMAAATPAMPEFWLEESQQRANKNGGNWFDAKNVAAPLAKAAIQNVILGQVSKLAGGAANATTKTALGNLGARAAVGGAAMPIESAAAEALTGGVQDALEEAGFGKYLDPKEDRYRLIRDMRDGKWGDVGTRLASESLLGAGFSAFHKTEAKPVEALQDLVTDLRKKGYSKPKAAEIIQKDVGGLLEDIQAGRDVTKEIQGLPEGKVRDYVQSQADAAKSATPPEKPTVGNSPPSDTEIPGKTPETAPDAIKGPPEAPVEPNAQPAPGPEIAPPAKAGEIWSPRQWVENLGMKEAGKRTAEMVDASLKAGKEVSLWLDGKEVPIKSVEGGMMRDAEGRPWGVGPLAMPVKGAKTGLEFKSAKAEPAPEGWFRVPNYKAGGEVSNLSDLRKELFGQSFPKLWFAKGNDAADPYHGDNRFQIEFDPSKAGGPDDVIEHRGKNEVGIGGKAPMAMHPALKAIRFKGSEKSQDFIDLKESIDGINQDRVKEGLDPIAVEATQKSTPAKHLEAGTHPAQQEADNAAADAARAGHSPAAISEALRRGEEAGFAEGQALQGAEGPRPQDQSARPADSAGNEAGPPQAERPVEPGTQGPATQPPIGQPLSAAERKMGGIGGGQENAEPTPQFGRETALANAVVDKERAKNGLPPLMAAARKENAKVWDEAMAILGHDPTASARLVDDLSKNMRATTVEENALLLHRQIALNNEYERSMRQAVDAMMRKNPSEFDRLNARADEVKAELDKVNKVAGETGTEWGRAGQFRKQLAAEDFTLGKMIDEATRHKREPLTPEETAKITKLQKEIEELQQRYDISENLRKRQEQEKQKPTDIEGPETPKDRSVIKKIGDWLGGIFSPKKAIVGKLPKPKSELWNTADRWEKDAAKELKAKFGDKLFSGFDPTAIAPLAKYTAAKIIKTGLTFAEFSKAVTERFGDAIKPHIQAIWDRAQQHVNESQKPEDPVDIQIDINRKKKDYGEIIDQYKRKNRPVAQKVIDTVKEANNATRALITAYDLSATLRQGGMLSLANPTKVPGAFAESIRSLASPRAFERSQLEILRRPNARNKLYEKSGLYLADQGGPASRQEEAFIGRWVKKIPGVAGSERAYTAYLNRIRADVFDSLTDGLVRDGKPDLREAKAIANFINKATGRGTLPGKFDQAAADLAQVFFSPRYLASRFQVLAGQPLYGGTWRTRGVIAKQYAKSLVGLAVVYALAKAADSDMELSFDPRSADFGKMKFGNFRVDPLAGFSQLSTFGARMVLGESKSTETGKVTNLRNPKPKPYDQTTGDVFLRFLRNKAAPLAGEVSDVLFPKYAPKRGKGVIQEATGDGRAARIADRFVPISINDVYDAMKDQGLPRGPALAMLAILGMGTQLYETRVKK